MSISTASASGGVASRCGLGGFFLFCSEFSSPSSSASSSSTADALRFRLRVSLRVVGWYPCSPGRGAALFRGRFLEAGGSCSPASSTEAAVVMRLRPRFDFAAWEEPVAGSGAVSTIGCACSLVGVSTGVDATCDDWSSGVVSGLSGVEIWTVVGAGTAAVVVL